MKPKEDNINRYASMVALTHFQINLNNFDNIIYGL